MSAKKKLPRNAKAVVDEYGGLDSRLQQVAKELGPRHRQLKAEILGWFEDSEPEKPYIVEGETHSVMISEQEMVRTITSMPKLLKGLGQKLFLQLATFSLKHVDNNIPEGERGRYLTEARTGKRRLKCVEKLKLAA